MESTFSPPWRRVDLLIPRLLVSTRIVMRLHLGLCFVGVLLSVAAGPELKIAVNSTTIESFPVFAAAETLSTQIQLVRSPSGRNAMSQLLNGEVDAATGSETQALLNSVADPRIRRSEERRVGK